MGQLRQDQAERAELLAAWEAHPDVAEMRDQVEAFAWREDLSFDAEGLSAVLKFGNQWQADNQVKLPDSGILIG